MDSTSVVEDYKDTAAAIDASSADQMAAAQSEDTNDIPSTSTTVETTTAISTPTDKTTITTLPKPSSSSINKLQNVKWRKEWRGIHLPPSADILNSKFHKNNDIIDEIVESESNEIEIDDVEGQHIEVPMEVLPIEAPIVEEVEPIEDTSQQQTSLLYQNQPSIPLYPLLLTIILYQLLKYIFRKLFSYKKRIKFMRSMKCRINSLGGNYEQFTISQSELEGHIEKLKSRNEKKRKEIDDKQKNEKKKKGNNDMIDASGKRDDDDTDRDDRGMGDETDENENEGGDGYGSNTGTTNNKSSEQQSGNNSNKGYSSYSSSNHSSNHNDQAMKEYKVKVQQLTKQNEVLLLKVNQLEVENEQLDNEMEHMMDEMCNIDENEDSHDGKEIDISGSYSDTIVESLTDDEEDTLLQELEDAKANISTLTKEHQVAREEVLRLSMEVAKLTSDREDLEQRLKTEEGKRSSSYDAFKTEEGKRSSSYDALLAERDVLNDTLMDINKSIQDAHDIVSDLTGYDMEQDDTSLEEDNKTTHELARHSASRLLCRLSRIKENSVLLPPPSPPTSPPSPTSPTDQASFDRLEMGRKADKMIETSVVSSTVSSPAAGDLCLIESSSPQRQVDSTRRELFPSQGQVKEIVLLPKVLPPQPIVKDCAIAVDSQHTQDSTKGSSTSLSSGEESSAGGEWHNKPTDNNDIVDDSTNKQSISYGMNETYCSDDEYDVYDNDLIVGFKDSLLKAASASRDVDAMQRSRGLSKLVRMWSKRSERSKW